MKRLLAALSISVACFSSGCGGGNSPVAGSGAGTTETLKSHPAENSESTTGASAPGKSSSTGGASVSSGAGANNSGTPFEAIGFISDSTCGANHSFMIKTGSMGETDESCVRECVRAGSRFVFVSNDGKRIFKLPDQESARKFAGQRVKVIGDLCAYGKELDKLKIEPLASGISSASRSEAPHK
jgi:hypothetical protein